MIERCCSTSVVCCVKANCQREKAKKTNKEKDKKQANLQSGMEISTVENIYVYSY